MPDPIPVERSLHVRVADQNPIAPALVRAGSMLAVVALLGCSDNSGPNARAGSALVHGTVTSVKTGQGIPGLIVALRQEGLVVRAAPTDADGRFAFADVASGSYEAQLTGIELSDLSERHTAFEPAMQAIKVEDQPVVLSFGIVGLIPPRVFGYVRCNGAVVPDAKLRVVGGNTDVTVVTNEQGKYGATDLTAGFYAVIPVDVPCAVDPSFVAVELKPGQGLEADFEG